jgi:hypothetical protein
MPLLSARRPGLYVLPRPPGSSYSIRAPAVRLRRSLLLAVVVAVAGTLVVRHRPTAAKIRAHNPVARLSDKLAEDLKESRLGRALSRKKRGPVVYHVR